MKAKNSTQQNTEETLNSLDGISKAGMPPFFFTRLQARLDKQSAGRVSRSWMTRPALSMITLSLLIILNIAAINYYVKARNTHSQETNAIQDFAQEYGLSVSSVYNDKTNR